MKNFIKQFLAAALVFSCNLLFAVDLARTPLQPQALAKPNVIFGMDDSGSMDLEVMLATSDGEFWWDFWNKTGWSSNGSMLFSADYSYGYLFPTGCSNYGGKHLCDWDGEYTVPPTPQFGFLRSSSYNPLYYNPNITYVPWSSATINGVTNTFSNASPTAARTHPLYSQSMSLTATQLSTYYDYVFLVLPGMKVPAGSVLPAMWYNLGACQGPFTYTTTVELTVASGWSCYAGIPYYPATYWYKQTCSVNNSTCVSAPDGATLQRYEIKSGNTFPSGRTYAAELQNFANWFTYYRKRSLMLSSSMGRVIDTLSATRVGVVSFNSLSTPTMYDTDSTNVLVNGKVALGQIYTNQASGGTPTRETLNYIGNQFSTNSSVVQYSCQRNAAVIITDGFAYASWVWPPSYNSTVYGSGAPYQTTYSMSLADIALSYYTNNIRPDLTAGKVPVSTSTDPSADKNPNPHMNTYAMTLGASGTIWPATTNAYTSLFSWPNPYEYYSPTSVDDLWHATVNGRGQMFRVETPDQTTTAAQSALTNILSLAGAQGAVSFSKLNLTAGDSYAYVGSFRLQGWSGEVSKYAINTTTGALASTATWSASSMLAIAPWSTRNIATFNGTGVNFDATNVGSIVNPSSAYGVTADVMYYLQGDRSKESITFRPRTGLMGGIVNAEPVVSNTEGVVFATSNEGMVHAFDKTTGSELWAYVPGFVLSSIGAQTQIGWSFQTILDGSPVLTAVDSRLMLVGGRGTGGTGYYALNVTGTKSVTKSTLPSRVMWEFPNSSTSAIIKSGLGASVGEPLVIKTARYGWVVVVTSGYNSARDGKGRVYVLDAITGAINMELVTTQGTVGAGDAGLAQLSAFGETTGLVQYLYGGDLLGNLWRFDIETGTVTLVATLKNSAGTALPITSAPELATISNRRMIFVGTGKMLGVSDFADVSTNSFFALWDAGTTITNVRTQLAPRTLTTYGTNIRATGSAVNWASQRGWYIDLPAGEKANTDPALGYGMVAWTTNKPSSTSCSSSSSLYVANSDTGLESLVSSYGMQLGGTLASRAVITSLPTGKIAITTHQSNDSTTVTTTPNTSASVTPKKTGWRMILH